MLAVSGYNDKLKPYLEALMQVIATYHGGKASDFSEVTEVFLLFVRVGLMGFCFCSRSLVNLSGFLLIRGQAFFTDLLGRRLGHFCDFESGRCLNK